MDHDRRAVARRGLGSGNRLIAMGAATDRIVASYLGVDNPHGAVWAA